MFRLKLRLVLRLGECLLGLYLGLMQFVTFNFKDIHFLLRVLYCFMGHWMR